MALRSAIRGREGLLFILFAVTGYAFLPVFAAYLRGDGMLPLDVVFWRYFITTPVLWLMSLQTRAPKAGTPGKPLPRIGLVVLGFALAIEGMAAFIGLQYLSPGIYLVLFYTYPAMTAILSTLLGEKLSAIGWAAVVLTLVGVTLTAADFVSLQNGLTFDQGQLTGAFWALLNATLAAVYFVAMERMMRGRSGTARASAWMTTGALVFLGVVVTVTQGIHAPAQSGTWVHLLALALVSTVMPVFLINKGIQAAGSTKAAIFGTIEPLLTAVLALVLLGETMQPIQWLGGAIVVGSVILLQLRGNVRIEETEAAGGAAVPMGDA